MMLSDFSITKHELRYKNPFTISGKTFTSKEVFYITLTDQEGCRATGECAPFPQFGTESVEAAGILLKSLSAEKINPGFLQEIKAKYPAVHAGMEQALLQLRMLHGENMELLFPGIKLKSSVKVNGVTGISDYESTISKIRGLLAEGYHVIKMKTGRPDPEDDIETVKRVRGELGYDFGLRLDLNGGWDVQKTRKYLPKLDQYNIEYVEQPVQLLHDFLHIKGYSSIPLAADESLMSFLAAMNIIENELAQVFIIKPAVLGGVTEALRIISLAEANGIKPVVTTSLESSLGKRMAVFCAAALKEDIHCGLSTAGMISNDPTTDIYPVDSGVISLGNHLL